MRSWPVVAVGVLGAVLLWLGAGAPWWAPAGLVAGVVVGSLVGRAVAVVVPGAQRWGLTFGAVTALVWLAVQLSVGGRLLVAGLVLLMGALAVVVPRVPERPDGGGPPPHVAEHMARARRVRMGAGALASLLLVGGLVVVGVERVRAANAQAAMDQAAGDFTRAQMLPPSPSRALTALIRAVAEDEPRGVCSAFTPAAGAQLGAAHGAADCPGAIHQLHGQVRDPRRYASPDRDSVTETIAPDGQTGTTDGCALHWTGLPALLRGPTRSAVPPPGPMIGRIDGVREFGQGFRITSYQPC